MNMRTIAGIGLTTLLLGGTLLGGVHGGGVASASTRSSDVATKQAAGHAAKAMKALAKGDTIKAVTLAEAAVALRPEDAGYRALLGQAYLKAGRFASASTTFADVLVLTPENGKAALNLALAQIAEGQWDAARQTLETHTATIPASDRGLAVALAGDPAAGVEILTAATRTPEATGKTRQNLALAMALAGRWREARTIVGTDLGPAEADARIVQWAAFAKPVGAADQVAALLGVVPVKDPGQPVALALVANVPVAQAAAEPVTEYLPEQSEGRIVAVEAVDMPEAPLAPAAPVDPTPPAAVATASVGTANGIVFGERREVVQTLPPLMADAAPVRTISAKGAFKTRVAAFLPVAATAPRAPSKGNFYVQIGAYESAGVARDAWARATRRYAAFAGHTPAGMAFKGKTGSFYRLAVGGFARPDADALCRTYRTRGGTCFVRTAAGDQVAAWVKPGAKAPGVLLAAK